MSPSQTASSTEWAASKSTSSTPSRLTGPSASGSSRRRSPPTSRRSTRGGAARTRLARRGSICSSFPGCESRFGKLDLSFARLPDPASTTSRASTASSASPRSWRGPVRLRGVRQEVPRLLRRCSGKRQDLRDRLGRSDDRRSVLLRGCLPPLELRPDDRRRGRRCVRRRTRAAARARGAPARSPPPMPRRRRAPVRQLRRRPLDVLPRRPARQRDPRRQPRRLLRTQRLVVRHPGFPLAPRRDRPGGAEPEGLGLGSGDERVQRPGVRRLVHHRVGRGDVHRVDRGRAARFWIRVRGPAPARGRPTRPASSTSARRRRPGPSFGRSGGSPSRSPGAARSLAPRCAALARARRSASRGPASSLRAKAARGWRFVRWSGGCRGARPACSLQVGSGGARAVAVFARRA